MANDNSTGKLALALSAVAAAGGWAAFLKSSPVMAASGLTLPPEFLDMLSAWAQMTSEMDDQMAQIIDKLSAIGVSPTVQGYPANADTIDSGQMALSLNGVALPSLVIPDDFAIVIKAFAGNPLGSYVLVAGGKAGASGLSTSYPLSPGEPISLKVKNASSIYVAATVLPAWINFVVEQRSS